MHIETLHKSNNDKSVLYITAVLLPLNLLKVQFYKEKCDRLEEKVENVCRHTDVADVKQADGYVRERQLAVVQFAQNFIEKYLPESIHPFLIAGNFSFANRKNSSYSSLISPKSISSSHGMNPWHLYSPNKFPAIRNG